MTQPSPRTPSVRRTVTIAAVLVVGQMVLCSVIGWLMFGSLLTSTGRSQPDVGTPAPVVSYPDLPGTTAPPSAPASRRTHRAESPALTHGR